MAEKIKRKFGELLTSKTELKEEPIDEYARSKELIDKFLLLPKIYSGREVKLEVDFVGQAFPASKSLCSSFNLDYGRTIGVKVKIKKPKVDTDAFEYIFIGEDKLDAYFSLKQQNDIEFYGKLQFSENKIDDARANFVRKEYYVGGMTSVSMLAMGVKDILGEKRIIEADGRTIIKLTKILNQ